MVIRQNRFGIPLVLFFILSLSSCANAKALPTLDANQITSIDNNCEALYKSHIDAWASHNAENLRPIYTDDIVHFDGRPLFAGIDAVVRMAGEMYLYFPDWQMEEGKTYISEDSCLGIWINWGVFGFTQDNPGLEYDVLEYQDEKISFWRAFYSQNFHQAIDGKDLVDDDFLLQFASSWSSGNASKVVRIYAEDAELKDNLYGISIVGKQTIKEYANSFFAKSSKAKWELVSPFAESEVEPSFKDQYPFSSQGGVFSITVNDDEGNPCEIHIVVILTPNEEGVIQTQKIYYEANTLVTCGWAK